MYFSSLCLLSVEVYQSAALVPGSLCPGVLWALSSCLLFGVGWLLSNTLRVCRFLTWQSLKVVLLPGCFGFPHSFNLLSISSFVRVNPLNPQNLHSILKKCSVLVSADTNNKVHKVSAVVFIWFFKNSLFWSETEPSWGTWVGTCSPAVHVPSLEWWRFSGSGHLPWPWLWCPNNSFSGEHLTLSWAVYLASIYSSFHQHFLFF